MKAPDLKKWNLKPELEGLLFFAQCINELLFDYSIDTYKIPALNSRTLAVELQEATRDYESNILRKGAIEPIVAELVDALRKDPVIQELFGSYFEELLDALRKEQTVPELKIKVDYLLNRIGDGYLNTCIQLIKKMIDQPKEKDKIMRLARIYVNELIDKGYSAEYVFFESNRFFFASRLPPRIERTEIIEDYLRMFNFQKRPFNIIYRVGRSFSIAKGYAPELDIEIVDKCPDLAFLHQTDKVDKFTGQNNECPLYLIVKVEEAFDEVKARAIADEQILLFDSLAKYHVHRSNLVVTENALVYSEDQKRFNVYRRPNRAVLKRPDRPSEKLSQLARETIANITSEKLDEQAFYRLIRALKRHQSAIRSDAPENQLLEFWSTVEVLFPPISDSSDRIVQIGESMIPFICSEYAAKLSSDLLISLRASGRPEALEYLNEVPEGGNDIEKCLALFSIENNELLRQKFYALFEWHPLLRNRIYSLSKKFSSADAVRDTIFANRQRVSWQLQRIYRARNLIVHSGSTLPYVTTLVENIHSYVDRVLDVINERIFRSSHAITIDQIALQVRLEFEAHLRTLVGLGKTKCTSDNFKLILFGNR